jgi:hypothetical protein
MQNRSLPAKSAQHPLADRAPCLPDLAPLLLLLQLPPPFSLSLSPLCLFRSPPGRRPSRASEPLPRRQEQPRAPCTRPHAQVMSPCARPNRLPVLPACPARAKNPPDAAQRPSDHARSRAATAPEGPDAPSPSRRTEPSCSLPRADRAQASCPRPPRDFDPSTASSPLPPFSLSPFFF